MESTSAGGDKRGRLDQTAIVETTVEDGLPPLEPWLDEGTRQILWAVSWLGAGKNTMIGTGDDVDVSTFEYGSRFGRGVQPPIDPNTHPQRADCHIMPLGARGLTYTYFFPKDMLPHLPVQLVMAKARCVF